MKAHPIIQISESSTSETKAQASQAQPYVTLQRPWILLGTYRVKTLQGAGRELCSKRPLKRPSLPHVTSVLPCHRYTKTAINAQTFNITQFGLSVFKQVAQPTSASPAPAAVADASANGSTPSPTVAAAPAAVHYEASTFNFYIFPEPLNERETPSRKFMCDSGSLSFLASQVSQISA